MNTAWRVKRAYWALKGHITLAKGDHLDQFTKIRWFLR
jgi:hypothetical protein